MYGFTNVNTVTLPSAAIRQLAAQEQALELMFAGGTVIFDAAAVYSLGRQASGTNVSVALTTAVRANLSEAQAGALPADVIMYNVAITSGNREILELNGTITISVPYEGPLPAAVWLLTYEGKLILLYSVFNEAEGILSFETTKPGLFVLAQASLYERVIVRFTIGNIMYTVGGVAFFNDVAPFIDPAYQRTMVPLRAVATALNVDVDWVAATRTALIFLDTGVYELPIGRSLPGGMGTPVVRYNRVFIPLRYVAQLLNAQVRWDGANRAAYQYRAG